MESVADKTILEIQAITGQSRVEIQSEAQQYVNSGLCVFTEEALNYMLFLVSGNSEVKTNDQRMAKVRIDLRVDEDIVEGYKALAEATPGGKYQAIMHEALRAYLDKEEKTGVEARIARLEAIINKLKL